MTPKETTAASSSPLPPAQERPPGERRIVLVTGATAQLGQLVIEGLLAQGCRVHALVRDDSPSQIEPLRNLITTSASPRPLMPIRGEATEPGLGLNREGLDRLREVTEIIHLARPRAQEVRPPGALGRGLEAVIGLARTMPGLRRVVVLSTTAVAGDFFGRFYEDWLDVGQSLPTEAGRSALELERRARQAARALPLIVVRHAPLVGHSKTGHRDCEAGLSRLFALGPLLSRLPSRLRPPGLGSGKRFVTIAPVDFVARGIILLAGSDLPEPGQTFCLADDSPPTLEEFVEMVVDRLGGPDPGFRFPVDGTGPFGKALETAARVGVKLQNLLKREPGVLSLLLQRGEHDVGNATALLEPEGIRCPKLATYMDALYDGYRARKTHKAGR